MADIADRAQVEIEREIEYLLRSRKKTIRRSRETCLDCEADIPLIRQQMILGVQRCTGCQELRERYEKLHPEKYEH